MKKAGVTSIAGSTDKYTAAYSLPVPELLQKLRVTITKGCTSRSYQIWNTHFNRFVYPK